MAEQTTEDARIEHLDYKVATGTALVTGFPGFLAGRLMDELLAMQGPYTAQKRKAMARYVFLVQPKLADLAEQRLRGLEADHPRFEGRWEIVTGDITDQWLGMGKARYDELAAEVNVVWHLAAIYDLAVPEKVAYRVNVTGTIHVLDFCEACADLARLNYVSTCYVAGDRHGTIYEDELDEGQGHKNHYESTKFWAEVEVQRRAGDLPTVIFRPGIVVGDSTTGETDKYDGPYYLMKLLKKIPDWLPMLNVGKGHSLVNLVPVDFVAEAMAYLGLKEGVEGSVFQLADPNPMRARDIVAMTLDAMDKAPAVASLPPTLAEMALSSARIEKMLGMPRESLIYFNHDARFDTAHTQRELKDTAIRCPHLSTYWQTLVDYFETHPEKRFLDDRAV